MTWDNLTHVERRDYIRVHNAVQQLISVDIRPTEHIVARVLGWHTGYWRHSKMFHEILMELGIEIILQDGWRVFGKIVRPMHQGTEQETYRSDISNVIPQLMGVHTIDYYYDIGQDSWKVRL